MNTIIIVTPCLSLGGVERASANTVNGLHKNYPDYEIILIAIFKREIFFSIPENVKFYEPENFNSNKLSIIRTIFFLREVILSNKRKKPKVLVFGLFYGALTALSMLRSNLDLFVSHRQSPFFKWGIKIDIINMLAYKLKKPTGVIAQTEVASMFLQRQFRNSKVAIIPNIVRDVKLYPNLPREKVILAVGRPNDYLKGFDLLIQSFALIQNKDWVLHIAGGSSNNESLQGQARKLGILDRIKFLGQVKEIDVCFAYAGIFIIPSRSEGFPNALLEAMAAGCCCVAFDFVAGPKEIIKHKKNGLIVPNGDVAKMTNAIDLLINDSELRDTLSRNALSVRESYSINLITSQIMSFLQNKIASK